MGNNCSCCKSPHIRNSASSNDNNTGRNQNNSQNGNINVLKSQPIQSYKKYNLKKSIEYSDNITFLLELNNKKLMTGSSNGTMTIWNLDNFELEISIKEENKILCLLEFEPNMILCGTQSKSINLWNIIQNKKVNSFNKHLTESLCSLNFFISL